MIRLPLFAIFLALVLTAPAHAARRQVPQGWLGVVVDGPLNEPTFAQAEPEWDNIAGSGAESVRAAVYWRQIQPTSAADADFSRTDRLVLDAAKRRLTVLPVLQGTPDWAALHPGDLASPPRDAADFSRLLTSLVTRYGPKGSLWTQHPEVPRIPIREWQIWNEPNLTRYWNVAPWAPPYAKLVKAANQAIKAADPGAKTILAGLPNESWKALAQIYKEGAGGSFDVVTLHPYTGKPSNVVRIVKIVRRTMAKHKDAKMPVWVTELSWPAGVGHTKQEGDFATTDAGQAQRLGDGLELLADERTKLKIERVYWYTWLSAEGMTDSAFDYSGLRRLRGGVLRDAPALTTFRRMAKRLQGCAKRAGDARSCR